MSGGTLICTGNFELPDKNAAAHRVVNNAKLLKNLGFNTVFLGACRSERYFKGYVKRDYGVGFDIYEQSYPFSVRQWANQMFDIGNLQNLARQYPDTAAVILYNTTYASLLAAKKAFSPQGIRVIYDCTEWNGYTEGNIIKRVVKKLDAGLIESGLERHCDGVIAVSRTMRKRYEAKAPVLLLPPLVDTREDLWRQEPIEGKRFPFCYAGSPSDKDRLDLLLEAFSRLPKDKAELRIIGLTGEEYSASQGDEGGFVAPENISFFGRLSHRETIREILSCGCFVFLREPTKRNTAGFPTKFVEAYTCGVPIITTAVSDVSYYKDGSCVVLDEASPDRIAEAMSAILAQPASSRKIREAFDFRNYEDSCRKWLERTVCRTD